MKKVFQNVTMMLLIIGLFYGLTSIKVIAQPKENEKCEQMKVIKLVDMLNLDEKSSEKFISKFKASDKDIHAVMEELDVATLELELALRKNLSDPEVAKLNDKILQLTDKLASAKIQKIKDLRSVLTETQYAKLILFEKHSMQRMQKGGCEKAMMNQHKGCSAGQNMKKDRPDSELEQNEMNPDSDD